MPGHNSERYTTAHSKHTAAVCPLIDIFMTRIEGDEDNVTSAQVLYDEYIATCQANKIEPASKTKFGRALTQEGIIKTKTDGIVHYRCRLTRPVRTEHARVTAGKLHGYLDGRITQQTTADPLAYREGRIHLRRRVTRPKLHEYLDTDMTERRDGDPLARIYLGGDKQWGAKATRTLMENDIVTEYRGTLITYAEAEVRMASHKARGLPDAMYKIAANTYLDPYELNGEDVTTSMTNPGIWLNHTRRSPNCRTMACRYPDRRFRGMVVVALKTITLGDELTQDYNDKGEDWLND